MSPSLSMPQSESIALDIIQVEPRPDDSPDTVPAQKDQAPQGDLNPSDGSEALFSMYLDRASEDDKKMVEDWKSNTDGILVFTGLFSAVVAAFLAVSVQNIQRSPQDTSSFYLAHIYQQLSTQLNGSQPSIPLSLTNPIEPFIAPISSVWVNGLWFLSLVISLTCALLALLLQQWARRYLRVAYPRHTPQKGARIRAFYKQGVEELRIPLTVEVIPVLLHISLFLFFAGLSVYLSGLHPTIFKVVTTWIGSCIVLYAYLTVLPIIHKSNPCSSPLSSSFSLCLTGIRYILFRLRQRFPSIDSYLRLLFSRDTRAVRLDDFFSHSMKKTAEELAFRLGPSIDHHSLLWVLQSLDAHTDLEKFFVGLLRLCGSETGKKLNMHQGFVEPNKTRLSEALIELMDRTLSSNLVPKFVKQRRMSICTKVIESTSLFGSWWTLCRVLLGDWYGFQGCIEFGLFVQNWKEITTHKVTYFYAQCVAALTISIVRDHDERWYELASRLLGVSKTFLRKYIRNGDSILLANAVFIIRRTVETYSRSTGDHRHNIICASSKTLDTFCKLDIRSTLPELQNEFCGLWNQLVAKAQSDPPPHHGFVATTTLKDIRKLYIALHECSCKPPTVFYTTTDDRDPILDNPMSYPMCTIDDHRPSVPIPDLQFGEPTPDAGDGPPTPILTPMSTPTFPYPPIQPLIFPTPFPPPYHTLSAPTTPEDGHPIPSIAAMPTPTFPYLPGFFHTKLVDRSWINTFLTALTTQGTDDISQILLDILDRRWPELLQSVEMGHSLRHWSSRNDERFHPDIRRIVAQTVVSAQERDDRWISLVKAEFDIADRVLGDYKRPGDSVLLSILVHMTRQAFHTRSWTPRTLLLLSDFSIRDTFPELQHVFCALWNDIVLKASDQGVDNTYVNILREIQYAYIDLHQSTEAVLTAFSNHLDPVLGQPRLYRPCEVASHRQNTTIHTSSLMVSSLTQLDQSLSGSSPHHSPIESGYTPGGGTALQQAGEATIVVSLPSSNDYTPHSSQITDAMQDTTSSSTPNYSLETNRRKAYTPLVSTQFRVSPPSNTDPSWNGKIPFYPTGKSTMPRPRARGLVNGRNICFANTILQLLVHCPLFWNIFRELGELMGEYGVGKSQGGNAGMTPLVDATLRFLDEFVYEENSQSQTPQPQQQSTGHNPSGDEGKKEHNVVDSFEATYMYDVMKGKARLGKFLDSQQQDAEEFFDAYLEVLHEEFPLLLDSSSTDKLPKVEDEVSQSGKDQTGKRDCMADSVVSPITRIFSSKLRSTTPTTDQPRSDWRSLRLDILNESVRTIEDALARFSQSGLSCSGEARDKVLIESLPPVLVLYLNRLETSPSIVKVAKNIPFSPLLDIPPEIMAATARSPARYKLSGVLYHHGEFTSSGHYTVDVLDSSTEGGSGDVWLHIDDENVNKVHLEDKFPEDYKTRARDQCSTMLFYHRTTVAKT